MSCEASKTVVSRVHFSNKLLLIGAAIAALAAFSTTLLNAQTPVAPQITYRWETTVFSTTNFPVPTIAVDTSGNVYIANDAIAIKEILQPDGSYVSSVIVTGGLKTPQGIAVDAGGNVYIADTFNERILKASRNPDGSYSLPTEVVSGFPFTLMVSRSMPAAISISPRVLSGRFISWLRDLPPHSSLAKDPTGSTVRGVSRWTGAGICTSQIRTAKM